jgi:hypothetical protein
MSRSTKILVIGSNLIALWLTATFVNPSLLVPTIAAFALSWLGAVFLGNVVTGLVLSTIYLVPLACFLWFGSFIFWYYVIWLAALCGAMLPRAFGSVWAFPIRFNAPLVLWALVLALSWPIVMLREVDFVPAMLSQTGISGMSARLPQSPAVIAVWIVSVTSIALTGLLLLDWLFLVYPADRLKQFESRVIWPLFAGAACAAVVGAYQSTVDISFLHYTFFRHVGRAAGTMGDANAFGSAIALWIPITAAMVSTTGRRYMTVAWSGVFVILVIAVWGSGSRTALLASFVGLALLLAQARRSLSPRQLFAGALGAVVVCAGIAWLVPSTSVTRFRDMVPSLSTENLQTAVYQLWARDMYGTAAVQMIVEHPLVGVGVGGFNYQYGDVLYLLNGTGRPADNSQNWFRQQLAELGLLGSAGWIVWMVMFVWMLLKRPDPAGRRLISAAAKGAIVGLVSASLLGMPTQDTAVSISFVVIVCWCMKLKGLPGLIAADDAKRLSRGEWAAVLTVLACFLGGTVYEARTDLRRPVRALRMGFPYSYGFAPDKADPTIRWTGAKAVEVFPTEKRWLKLVIGDVAPDAESNPVQVKVMLNREVILRVNRRSSFPITRWIRMPEKYGTQLMIEIDVSRTWRPSDFGDSTDGQERGVAVHQWSFWDEDPPKGAVTFENPPAAID